MNLLLPLAGVALLAALGKRREGGDEDDAPETAAAAVDRIVRQAKGDLAPLASTALQDLQKSPRGIVIPGTPTRVPTPSKASSSTRATASKPPKVPSSADASDGSLAALAARAAAVAAQAQPEEAPPPKAIPVQTPAPRPTSSPSRAAAPAAAVIVPAAPARALPDGYDPAAARREAQNVANHLRKTKYDYQRRLLQVWQQKAGLTPDKVYGPQTADALRYYGAQQVPPPLFRKRTDGSVIRDSDPDARYIPPEKR